MSTIQGWECPRCRAINSPFKQTCDCVPDTYYGTGTSNGYPCPSCKVWVLYGAMHSCVKTR